MPRQSPTEEQHLELLSETVEEPKERGKSEEESSSKDERPPDIPE
jgi:hypothetical protein